MVQVGDIPTTGVALFGVSVMDGDTLIMDIMDGDILSIMEGITTIFTIHTTEIHTTDTHIVEEEEVQITTMAHRF